MREPGHVTGLMLKLSSRPRRTNRDDLDGADISQGGGPNRGKGNSSNWEREHEPDDSNDHVIDDIVGDDDHDGQEETKSPSRESKSSSGV